jgi:hypothetical protein
MNLEKNRNKEYYNSYSSVYIITCIARQRTDKYLATEYTQTTIEFRMLLLVAGQQSARQ